MEHLSLLGKIAGVVIILFGLHMMGVLKIGWLYSEKRMQTDRKPAGFFGAMLVGIAFAFGWTPCIGPILERDSVVAAAQETVGEGVQLLAVYSAGLGVPFIATSLAINKFFAASARIRKHYHTIEVVSGVLHGRRRRADLHQPLHGDRAAADAVLPDVLKIPTEEPLYYCVRRLLYSRPR